MALTPEDIEQHIFKVSRRGYDKGEVDRFLGEVAMGYRDLQQRADEVAGRPQAEPAELPVRSPGATTEGGGALFSLDRPPAPVPPLAVEGHPEPLEPAPGTDDFQRLGSEVADVLRTAHASVAQLRHEAEVEAAVTRQRADREVADLRRDAEVQAALVRQAAERDVAALQAEAESYASRLRAEADEYAAQVHVDTDRAATERAAAAALSLEQAEQRLAETSIAADALLAQADQRAAALLREAEVQALARRTELEAEMSRADAAAQAQREVLMAEAERRLELAVGTEAAVRARLVGARGDVTAALAKFPETPPTTVPVSTEREPEPAAPPTVDLTDERDTGPVIDLTDADSTQHDRGAGDSLVPPGWPGAPPPTGRPDDLFGDRRPVPGGVGAVATDLASPPAPEAPPAPAAIANDLPDIVRNAIDRAVQSTVDRNAVDPI